MPTSTPQQATMDRVAKLPPYRVILHNDDVNTFDHVIRVVLRLTGLSTEEAVRVTLEAHHRGTALVLVTHRERAELFCEQFKSCQITTTCEPD